MIAHLEWNSQSFCSRSACSPTANSFFRFSSSHPTSIVSGAFFETQHQHLCCVFTDGLHLPLKTWVGLKNTFLKLGRLEKWLLSPHPPSESYFFRKSLKQREQRLFRQMTLRPASFSFTTSRHSLPRCNHLGNP